MAEIDLNRDVHCQSDSGFATLTFFFSSTARGERPADGEPLENLLTAIPGGDLLTF